MGRNKQGQKLQWHVPKVFKVDIMWLDGGIVMSLMVLHRSLNNENTSTVIALLMCNFHTRSQWSCDSMHSRLEWNNWTLVHWFLKISLDNIFGIDVEMLRIIWFSKNASNIYQTIPIKNFSFYSAHEQFLTMWEKIKKVMNIYKNQVSHLLLPNMVMKGPWCPFRFIENVLFCQKYRR